jgi:hypothetical protein
MAGAMQQAARIRSNMIYLSHLKVGGEILACTILANPLFVVEGVFGVWRSTVRASVFVYDLHCFPLLLLFLSSIAVKISALFAREEKKV